MEVSLLSEDGPEYGWCGVCGDPWEACLCHLGEIGIPAADEDDEEVV